MTTESSRDWEMFALGKLSAKQNAKAPIRTYDLAYCCRNCMMGRDNCSCHPTSCGTCTKCCITTKSLCYCGQLKENHDDLKSIDRIKPHRFKQKKIDIIEKLLEEQPYLRQKEVVEITGFNRNTVASSVWRLKRRK